MKAFVEKITRPSRKWTDQFIIAAILSVVLLVAGSVVSDIIYKATDAPSLFEKWLGSDNLAAFFSEYLMFIGIWIITFLFVVVPKSNRPMLKAWGYNRDGNNIKGIIAGTLLGFGCNGFCVLMSVLMGDIKLSFYGFNPTILLAFLLVVMIQSGAEEITDRLYLYQKLRRRYKSPLFAIIINPVVFMLLHVVNDGFTVLAGVQNIIFGLPNSGRVSDYSIFKLEAASAQSGLFYDVEFGVEGSIGSTLVLAVVLAVIIFINRGKGEKRDYWADAASDAGYESKH